jgi:hypothetical protein
MRKRIPLIFAMLLGLSALAIQAHAGVIRSAGKEFSKGSARVTSAAATGGHAAASGAAAAGEATGGALKNGAAEFAKGAKATPKKAARGTEVAAKKVWRVIR